MRTASSASRTYGRSASASEYTATARIPIRRAVLITRLAISPRLATSTDSSIRPAYWVGGGLDLDDGAAIHYAVESLDRGRVVLAGRVEPEPLHRLRGPARVRRAAHQVVEGVGGLDDAAAQWRPGRSGRRARRVEAV